MAMTIPLEAFNWLQFYKEARSKGITIKSRYKGVSVRVMNGGSAYWQAQLTAPDGTRHRFKVFPFNREGERMAGYAYESACQQYGYDPAVGKPNLRNAKKIL